MNTPYRLGLGQHCSHSTITSKRGTCHISFGQPWQSKEQATHYNNVKKLADLGIAEIHLWMSSHELLQHVLFVLLFTCR